jgi:hypothetical protein
MNQANPSQSTQTDPARPATPAAPQPAAVSPGAQPLLGKKWRLVIFLWATSLGFLAVYEFLTMVMKLF